MEIELSRVVRAIRRFWWMGASIAVAVGIIASLLGVLAPKTYTSDSGLLIVPTSTLVGNPDTIIDLARNERALRPILDEFGINTTAQDFVKNNVSAYGVTGTSIVRIEVKYSDAQTAADITNAIANSVKTRSYDVGLGVLQRELNNLVYGRDQIDIQLATINAQIDQIDNQTGELSSEDQVYLNQLQSQRLRLEQRRADFENSIRSAQNDIATFIEPVIINDVAVPAVKSDGISPVVLGAIGVVLGGLIGIAVMLWLELRDTRVRDGHHLAMITGVDSIVRVPAQNRAAAMQMAAYRVAGVARTLSCNQVLAVSARDSANVSEFADAFQHESSLETLEVTQRNAVLDAFAPVQLPETGWVAALFVDQNRSTEADIAETIAMLKDFGISRIIPVLVEVA